MKVEVVHYQVVHLRYKVFSSNEYVVVIHVVSSVAHPSTAVYYDRLLRSTHPPSQAVRFGLVQSGVDRSFCASSVLLLPSLSFWRSVHSSLWPSSPSRAQCVDWQVLSQYQAPPLQAVHLHITIPGETAPTAAPQHAHLILRACSRSQAAPGPLPPPPCCRASATSAPAAMSSRADRSFLVMVAMVRGDAAPCCCSAIAAAAAAADDEEEGCFGTAPAMSNG